LNFLYIFNISLQEVAPYTIRILNVRSHQAWGRHRRSAEQLAAPLPNIKRVSSIHCV